MVMYVRSSGRWSGLNFLPESSKGICLARVFQALITYVKGSLHASYSGLETFCGEVLGIEVSRSHQCNTIARVNEALAAPYAELQEHIHCEPEPVHRRSGRWRHRRDVYDVRRPGGKPTNNLAEQAIRFVIIDRCITRCTRSQRRQRCCERIWTAIATCAQQQRSVFEHERDAISTRFNDQPNPSPIRAGP